MTIWFKAPWPRIELVLPAWAEQYQRDIGEPMTCDGFDLTVPLRSACTGAAEIRVEYGWRREVRPTLLCRVCAGALLEQLRSAIEVVDAYDDPRRAPR